MRARSLGHSANENGRQLLCRKSARAIFILPGAAGSLGASQSFICEPVEVEMVLDFFALDAQLVMVPFAGPDRLSDDNDVEIEADDEDEDVAIEVVDADLLSLQQNMIMLINSAT